MKFSVNWLREFVDLPAKIEELADLLTRSGIEIEAVEHRGGNLEKLIVAQITASARHPNADRLTVCQVDDGSGQTRQIVCGATNYKVGDKVPLALPGVTLPNGLKIRASKLRGVDSEGMLCSGKELGLSEDAAGLLILSPEARIGASMVDLFPPDTILDVEITPNRGDLISHFGLAREIAALVGTALRAVPEVGRFGETSLPIKKDGVKITALHECPFYSARRLDNVTVGPSPDWLRAKIEAVGFRSINNVVDITNFVMLELGEPLHAFDADKLQGEINIRLAHDDEKFLALDGKTHSLTSADLMIADAERAVAIAGVMGGEDTGVTESTRNVLLESAYFLPSSIRRTARTLNLPSDASYRFERGVDPGMILPASSRAAELIREIANGNPAKEIGADGKVPSNPADVLLSYQKCDQVLGHAVKPKTIDHVLERFGLSKSTRLRSAPARQASKSKNKETSWKIPSYRRDLQRDVDLIEEIVRTRGVQEISGTDRSQFTPSSPADREYDLESNLRERMIGRGVSEARTSALIPLEASAFGEPAIELRNPLSQDHAALRPSLIAGLLGVLARNVRAGAERVAIFELGRVFLPPSGKEERRLGLLLWGNATSTAHWRSLVKHQIDFFDLKGVIESACAAPLSFRQIEHRDLALATEIWLGNRAIGLAAQLAAARAVKLDVTGPVFAAELNVDLIFAMGQATPIFRELERFPAITRDVAMIVPEKIRHAEIVDLFKSVNEPLLESVQLFDLFTEKESSSLGAERKSLAYRLTYRDKSRTLTSEEVTAAHAKIRERLQRELGAELRE
jgi:phenylalanyl-tRNA synthetase beta chain